MKTLAEIETEGTNRGILVKYKTQAIRDYASTQQYASIYDSTLIKKRIIDWLPNTAFTVDENTNLCSVDIIAVEALLNENS